MRLLPGLKYGFVILCLCAARSAFGCDQLPAGQHLWIRLTAPISTYTAKAGDLVHAVLTQDLVCENEIVLPMGTPIEGVVRNKRKVGWGIRHETATLELEFNHAINGPAVTTDFTARVEEVENARELVHNGIIQGVRSTNTFQGSINSRLIHLPTWNPYSDPVLIAYKAVFPIFPEPEIYYPAGTDIRLRTSTEISLPPSVMSTVRESSDISIAETDRLDLLVGQIPTRVTTSKNINADLVNIIFLGSQETVNAAFHTAGWHNADPVSTHAVMMNLYALLNNSGYAQEPMMTFYLNGKPEDMNWQNSLNSYGHRDHLRIWQWTPTEGADPVWVSSSTRDTGAVLSVKHKGFVHHIAPAIDEERSTIIRDLDFAGCVSSVSYVARPSIPATIHNATGDVMRTDGSVAMVTLQECSPTQTQLHSNIKTLTYRPGNYAFRFIRRQILTFKNDMLRANIIYGTYDVGRRGFAALRHQPPIPPITTAADASLAFQRPPHWAIASVITPLPASAAPQHSEPHPPENPPASPQ